MNEILHGDSYELIKEISDESIDLMCTDPPYGISFMSRNWDKAIPPVSFWKECVRVLKPGAFAFVMCLPRQDCLARMIVNLEEAGFETGFSSLYWTFASGFPKATNVSIAIDKRACYKQLMESLEKKPTKDEFETAWKKFREIIRNKPDINHLERNDKNIDTQQRIMRTCFIGKGTNEVNSVTAPASPEAKALDGSYASFSPKPATEIILVVMKPLDCKTYVEQALKNGKGVTWLDEGRIPIQNRDKKGKGGKIQPKLRIQNDGFNPVGKKVVSQDNQQGRFPANVLVSDDILNDGKIGKVNERPNCRGKIYGRKNAVVFGKYNLYPHTGGFPDSGSYSRYFDLDLWFAERLKQLPESVQKTFPWLIVPKPCPREKNQGCEELEKQKHDSIGQLGGMKNTRLGGSGKPVNNTGELQCHHNHHPTVKPLKLFTYLITIGSRPGDVILDPFVGSGTTALACHALNRKFLCIEKEQEYYDITCARLAHAQRQLMLDLCG